MSIVSIVNWIDALPSFEPGSLQYWKYLLELIGFDLRMHPIALNSNKAERTIMVLGLIAVKLTR